MPVTHTNPATTSVDAGALCVACTNNNGGKLPNCWFRNMYLARETVVLAEPGTATFAAAPATGQPSATLVADAVTGEAPEWIDQGDEVTINGGTVSPLASPAPTGTGATFSGPDALKIAVGDQLRFPNGQTAIVLTGGGGTAAVTWDTTISPTPASTDLITVGQVVLVLEVVGLVITFQDNIIVPASTGITQNGMVPSEELIDRMVHTAECTQFTELPGTTMTILASPAPTATTGSVTPANAALLTVGDLMYWPTTQQVSHLQTVNPTTGAITWDTAISPVPTGGTTTFDDLPGNVAAPTQQQGAPGVDVQPFAQPEDEYAPPLPVGVADNTTPVAAVTVTVDGSTIDFPDPFSE